MTAEEFIEWYEEQPARLRYELLDGEIHEMSPRSPEVEAVRQRITAALRRQIVERVLPAHVVVDDVPVWVDEKTVFEPDAFVRFSTEGAPETRLVRDPAIVVQVGTAGDSAIALDVKVKRYFDNASIVHVLVVDPGARTVIHHERVHGGGIAETRHAAGRVDMPFQRIDLVLADIFGT